MLKPINIAVAVLFVAVIGLGYMVVFQDSDGQESRQSRPIKSPTKSPTQAPASRPATAPTEEPTYCKELGVFNPRGALKGRCESNQEFWNRRNAIEQEGRACQRNGGEWNSFDGICAWK